MLADSCRCAFRRFPHTSPAALTFRTDVPWPPSEPRSRGPEMLYHAALELKGAQDTPSLFYLTPNCGILSTAAPITMESAGPLRLFALVLLLASTHAQLSPGLIQDSECTLGVVFLLKRRPWVAPRPTRCELLAGEGLLALKATVLYDPKNRLKTWRPEGEGAHQPAELPPQPELLQAAVHAPGCG